MPAAWSAVRVSRFPICCCQSLSALVVRVLVEPTMVRKAWAKTRVLVRVSRWAEALVVQRIVDRWPVVLVVVVADWTCRPNRVLTGYNRAVHLAALVTPAARLQEQRITVPEVAVAAPVRLVGMQHPQHLQGTAVQVGISALTLEPALESAAGLAVVAAVD